MDALLKLKDTKSTAKPGFTLLHFLVQHCLQHNPSALDVVSDLEPCGDAALFPYDFLAKDVVAIEASLHELQGAIRLVSAAQPADSEARGGAGLRRLAELEAQLQPKITELRHSCEEYEAKTAEFCTLLSEKPEVRCAAGPLRACYRHP